MPHVSLRCLALALCVAAAVAIGALTLSVSVTRAMTALRAMGDRHAMALADVLRWELEHFFELPSLSLDIMKNASRVDHGPWPGSSTLQTRRYLDQAMLHQFLMPDSCGVNFLFYDGIRVFSSLIGNISDSRFSDGVEIAYEEYFSQAGFSNHRWFYDNQLRLLPRSDAIYKNPVQRISASTYLATLGAATWNGTQSGWLSQPIVAVILNTPQSFDMLVGPLRNPRKELIGFGGPYLYMKQFHRYLRSADFPTGSYAFVTDNINSCIFSSSYPLSFETLTLVPATTTPGRGCVLAAASAAADVNLVNPSTSNGSTYLYCRTPALQYAYPPLQVLMDDTSFALAPSLVTTFVAAGGNSYFAASAPIRARYPNVYLQLIVTMPETVVVGDLASQIGLAIGVSIVITLAFAIVVVVVVAMLLQPIVDMAEQLEKEDPMQRRRQGEGGDAETGTLLLRELSRLSEVRSVQLAHRAMQGELIRIRAFVPSNAHEGEVASARAEPEPSGPRATEADAVASSPSPLDDFPNPLDSTVSPPNLEDHEEVLPTMSSSVSMSQPSPAASVTPRAARRVRFIVDDNGASRLRTLEAIMTTRDVAVMAANVNGFHRVCDRAANESGQGRGAAIADVVRALMHQVRRAALRHGGAVESFNGDQVIVSFNANVFRGPRGAAANDGPTTLSATDRVSACRAALDAALELVHCSLSFPSDVENDAAANAYDRLTISEPIRWRVGVAHGTAIVGLAGTETTKAAHIIGSAWTHAATLEELGKVHRVRGVLVSDRFLSAANMEGLGSGNSIEWRVMGSRMLPGRVIGRESAIVAVRRRQGPRPGTPSLPLQARAVKMYNAQRVLTVEGRAEEAAQVTRALTALLGGEAERAAWELREALRWSDVPALERLHEELHLRGATVLDSALPRELRALLLMAL